MKNLTKKQEKGALLVEIVAVIALLGVMGPLLFKQVSERNEEVDNINIATEMRVIKEAFASYILTNHTTLSSELSTEMVMDMDDAQRGAVKTFLPEGYGPTLDHYHLSLIKNTTSVNTNQLQGYITPNFETLGLQGMTLRRVARIANLIGADGGIIYAGSTATSGAIKGTGGAWQADKNVLGGGEDLIKGNAFVATTGLDTFVPEVVLEDFDQKNIHTQETAVFKRALAYEHFAVANDTNCYENNSVTATGATAVDDEVHTPYEGGTCAPLFWVMTNNPEKDSDTSDGDVFVKNKLHIRPNPTELSHIMLESASGVQPPQIRVRSTDGTDAIILRGDGSIISIASFVGDGEVKMALKGGIIETDVKATKVSNALGKDVNYKVDPQYISVMGDIRLESRGGAKLSELLPKFNLKGVSTITGSGSVSIPTCPTDHYPAIVVTPVSWATLSEKQILSAVVDHINQSMTDSNLVDNGTMHQAHDVSPLPTVRIQRSGAPAEEVAGHFLSYHDKISGEWNITLGYSYQNDTDDHNGLDASNIKAVVQTYCVYDESTNTVLKDKDDERDKHTNRKLSFE